MTAAYNDELEAVGSSEDRLQRALYDGLVGGDASERELRELTDDLGFPLRTSYPPFCAAAPGANGGAGALARRLAGDGLLALTDGERVDGLAANADAGRVLAAAGATYAIGRKPGGRTSARCSRISARSSTSGSVTAAAA